MTLLNTLTEYDECTNWGNEIRDEIRNLQENNTSEIVDQPNGKKIIPCKCKTCHLWKLRRF